MPQKPRPLVYAALLLATPGWANPDFEERPPVAPPTQAACAPNVERLAVLIGVGDYPPAEVVASTSGVREKTDATWAKLSTSTDIIAIQSALRRFGFDDGTETGAIWRLEGGDATADGIRGLLQQLGDCAEQRGGASGGPLQHVYVHYSGHGQQIPDDDADETDGWDESWVAWGAPMQPEEGYDFRQHIRDDEIREALVRVRRGLGASGTVAMTSDSCHSGTISRSANVVARYAPPSGQPADRRSDTPSFELPVGAAGDASAASVILGASESDEAAYEDHPERFGLPQMGTMGRFTAAMVATLLDKDHPPRTWAELHERITADLGTRAPRQRPTLEGYGDIGLFGTAVGSSEPYAVITQVNARDNLVIIDGGHLGGFGLGTKVALHEAGAPSSADVGSRLATGTVRRAMPTKAWVALNQPAKALEVGARAFVTAEAYGSLALRVGFEEGATPDVLSAPPPGIQIVEDVDTAEVVVSGRAGALSLRRSIEREPFAQDVAGARLDAVLRSALRAKLLRVVVDPVRVPQGDDGFTLSAQLLDAAGDRLPQNPNRFRSMGTAGELALKREDRSFTVTIENKGTRAMFATVIFQDPDGSVDQVYPLGSLEHERLPPSGTKVLELGSGDGHVAGAGAIYLVWSDKPDPFRGLFDTTRNAVGPASLTEQAFNMLRNEASAGGLATRGLVAIGTSPTGIRARVYGFHRLPDDP